MAKYKSKKRYKPKGLALSVFCLLLIVAILTLFSKSFIQIAKKHEEKKELKTQLANLREEEETLTKDVDRLNDPEHVARFLKEKYFYSTGEEYIIRIPK